MKTSNYLKSTSFIVAVLFILFVAGCDTGDDDEVKPDCTAKIENTSVNINGFDRRLGSPYQNQVIAVFNISQEKTMYPSTVCQKNSATNVLTIQNTTSNKITFDFNITVFNNLNIAQWSYQNFVTINPNAVIVVGEISKSEVAISGSGSKILIQSNSVTYQ